MNHALVTLSKEDVRSLSNRNFLANYANECNFLLPCACRSRWCESIKRKMSSKSLLLSCLWLLTVRITLALDAEVHQPHQPLYKNWKLIEIEDQKLEHSQLIISLYYDFGVKLLGSPFSKQIKLLIPPTVHDEVMAKMVSNETNVQLTVIASNFNHYINKDKAKKFDESFAEKYHSYNHIIKKLNHIKRFNEQSVELGLVGKTLESRDIVAVKISLNRTESANSSRPIVVFECGIHAR